MAKPNVGSIELIKGIGIKGDVHSGTEVKHRYLARKDPHKENLRQVHLIHTELYKELGEKGFHISHGEMGENITTQGIDLLNLPRNTILRIGDDCKLKVTGLRNPCNQLNGIQQGLMQAVLGADKKGNLIRKAGIMSVVVNGGIIKPGDRINIDLPNQPFEPLEPV